MSTLLGAAADRRIQATLRGRDLLSMRDLTGDELVSLIALGADIKAHARRYEGVLARRAIAMLFEKPSLRTRVSFDLAAHQLGAHAIYVSPQEVGLGRREAAADVAVPSTVWWTGSSCARSRTSPLNNSLTARRFPSSIL